MNHEPEYINKSPVMTGSEAACYLRLCAPDDDSDTVGKAIRCLHKLVRDGKLRPLKPSKEYLFAHEELNRYIQDETEAFSTSKY